jgi:FHS family L-fucose permease-like MFS transporter
MVGRFAGVLLMRRFEPRVLLALAASIAALLVVATMLSHGGVALWSIVAIGLFNSIMFPTIFTLGIAGLAPRRTRPQAS